MKVSLLCAPVARRGEDRVGGTVGAAGVRCRHRQGGLADGQGAVDVDHGVVREVGARRQRNDRVGPDRRAGGGGLEAGEGEGVAACAPVAVAVKIGLAAP